MISIRDRIVILSRTPRNKLYKYIVMMNEKGD